MERVAFLVEHTGERVTCLLNPEHLDARRIAGVRVRSDAGGVIGGAMRSDDPLIASGGGATEFELRLLFDIDLANEGYRPGPGPHQFRRQSGAGEGSSPATAIPRYADVRELTRPLWQLAENPENAEGAAGSGAVPVVRFIWGKSWNVPAVILAIAERFDRFDTQGAPQRSWLSLRLRRVQDPAGTVPAAVPAAMPMTPQFELHSTPAWPDDHAEDVVDVFTDEDGQPQQRVDLIAAEHLGDPALARWLGEYNGLDDLLDLVGIDILRLPPEGWSRRAP